MTRLMTEEFTQEMVDRLAAGEQLWLFLDYDGTLAEFAPTPDHVLPDDQVIDLLERLSAHPHIRVSVISGRRMNHVQELLPVKDVLLAGTYGVEITTHEGELFHQVKHTTIRPVLEAIKPQWAALLEGRQGFYLEDKGWALAIHAKEAEEEAAKEVLAAAEKIANEDAAGEDFRILGGHRFLEVGPMLANKGRTVDYLLQRYEFPGALLVYVGDDDKDEEAFAIIQERGGVCVKVSDVPVETLADYRLESPEDVRHWLRKLASVSGE